MQTRFAFHPGRPQEAIIEGPGPTAPAPRTSPRSSMRSTSWAAPSVRSPDDGIPGPRTAAAVWGVDLPGLSAAKPGRPSWPGAPPHPRGGSPVDGSPRPRPPPLVEAGPRRRRGRPSVTSYVVRPKHLPALAGRPRVRAARAQGAAGAPTRARTGRPPAPGAPGSVAAGGPSRRGTSQKPRRATVRPPLEKYGPADLEPPRGARAGHGWDPGHRPRRTKIRRVHPGACSAPGTKNKHRS